MRCSSSRCCSAFGALALLLLAALARIANGAFEPWAAWIARFAAQTQACCKLSGLATEAGPGWDAQWLRPWVERLLTHSALHA
ncbi:hypothetical protein [Variovorax sp. RA8]|uniref:hypothetical protein n=1 Tax=Variovorax sp. (strain JCM 16519 / RA8) TaxID=662548 RepID=UPI0013A535E6|nr:hypothetical protein [Variovorax sp. RA8]